MSFPGVELYQPAPEGVYGCCWASINSAGDLCSCWIPVFDVEPSEALQEGPAAVLRRSCHDCAYRLGSPEREALEGGPPEYGRHQPFLCHQGVPRIVAWQHPAGVRVDVDPLTDDYLPTQRGDRAWRADGSPAELCAGWAATNRIRTTPTEGDPS